MIFYFSGTGNCKYVAKRISDNFDDRIISIAECIKNEEYSFEINNNEFVGIISPTYMFGLPSIVIEFLKKLNLKLNDKTYLFFVSTYGTTPGQAGYFANNYMKESGHSFNSYFSVQMPDVWTPMFDLSNREEVKAINLKEEPQIDFIINKIKESIDGDFMKGKMPRLLSKCYYKGYEKIRKTKKFVVEDTCIGCGLCAQNCPINAIEIKDGKPVWVKDKCVMCLGCLHRCPKFAIQYGKKTKEHGQYVHPNVTL